MTVVWLGGGIVRIADLKKQARVLEQGGDVAAALTMYDEILGELERLALVRADLVFIFLELFIVIPFIVHGKLSVLSAKEALGMVMGGPYTTVFWGGVVALGILLPLVLELMDVAGALRRLPGAITRLVHIAAPLLILVGGYLLRWVFVHAGQETSFL